MKNYYDNLSAYSKANLRECQLKQLDILAEIDRICRKHHIDYWLDGGTLLGAVRHGGFIPWDDDIDIAMGYKDMIRFEHIATEELPDGLRVQSPRTGGGSKEPIVKIRDLNSLYIERGDHFQSDYLKGIYVDIFPFVKHPDVPKKWIKTLHKGMSKSYSILHHLHGYSLRAFAEFFWFGAKYHCYNLIWHLLCLCCRSSRYANLPIINGYGITHEEETVLPVSIVRFEGKDFPAPHDPDRYLRNIYGNYMEIPPEGKRKIHAVFILPSLVKEE